MRSQVQHLAPAPCGEARSDLSCKELWERAREGGPPFLRTLNKSALRKVALFVNVQQHTRTVEDIRAALGAALSAMSEPDAS